jgi:hypothetical protein
MSWTGHDGNGHGRKYVHITETPDVRHIANPDVMHEESDVNVRGVATFVGILAAGIVLIGLLMIMLFKGFERYAEYKDERIPVSPMARTEQERRPPPPVLQAAPGFRSLDDPKMSFELREPSAEWDALREKWNWELNNPGAIDPGTQTMRVPIEDAKQLLLNKGLPVRQQQSGDVGSAGMDVPSYSSAGRQMEKRNQ